MHKAATSRVRTETVYIGFAAEQYETARIENAMHARPRPHEVKLRAGHGRVEKKQAIRNRLAQNSSLEPAGENRLPGYGNHRQPWPERRRVTQRVELAEGC